MTTTEMPSGSGISIIRGRKRRRRRSAGRCWFVISSGWYYRYLISWIAVVVVFFDECFRLQPELVRSYYYYWSPSLRDENHQQRRNLNDHRHHQQQQQNHTTIIDPTAKEATDHHHHHHQESTRITIRGRAAAHNNNATTINTANKTTSVRGSASPKERADEEEEEEEDATPPLMMEEDDLHYTKLEILPLRDWEERSLRGLYDYYYSARSENSSASKQERRRLLESTCQPPSGIPQQCCIGTFAGMGRIIHNQRYKCAHSNTLHQMQQLLLLQKQQQQQQQQQQGCSVCHLLEYLRARNQTMTLVGDSMSHQIFQGLLCELYRRNYEIVKETNVRIPPTKPTQAAARAARPGRRRRQQQQRGGNHHPNNNHNNISNCTTTGGINHCLHLIRTIQISSPLWSSSTSSSSSSTNTADADAATKGQQPQQQQQQQQQQPQQPQEVVTLKFFHIYRLPFASRQEEELVLHSGDILVLNFGLHWGANYYRTSNSNNYSAKMTSEKDIDNTTTTTSSSSPIKKADSYFRKAATTRYYNHPGGITSPNNPPTPEHLETVLTEFLHKVVDHNNKNNNSNKNSRTNPTRDDLASNNSDTDPGGSNFKSDTGANYYGPMVRHVLFRETSAQHFDSDGGDFSFVKKYLNNNKRKNKEQSFVPSNKGRMIPGTTGQESWQQQAHGSSPSLRCVPYREGPTSGWREKVVQRVFQDYDNYYYYYHKQQAPASSGNGIVSNKLLQSSSSPSSSSSVVVGPQEEDSDYYPTLTILPFLEHTKVLHDMHPYDDDYDAGSSGSTAAGDGEAAAAADCTHYCSSPFLYATLWKSIRDALP